MPHSDVAAAGLAKSSRGGTAGTRGWGAPQLGQLSSALAPQAAHPLGSKALVAGPPAPCRALP